jgi:hypothetical protein
MASRISTLLRTNEAFPFTAQHSAAQQSAAHTGAWCPRRDSIGLGPIPRLKPRRSSWPPIGNNRYRLISSPGVLRCCADASTPERGCDRALAFEKTPWVRCRLSTCLQSDHLRPRLSRTHGYNHSRLSPKRAAQFGRCIVKAGTA